MKNSTGAFLLFLTSVFLFGSFGTTKAMSTTGAVEVKYPLHEAIANNSSLEDIKEIINGYNKKERKAKLDETDNFGHTPLHYALLKQNAAVACHLIEEENVSRWCTDKKENTPLHYAVEYALPQVVDAIIAKNTQYKKKSQKRYINQRNNSGDTALHVAAAQGDTGMIDILLDNEAKPETKNNSGNIPLHTAISNIQFDSVKQLLKLSNREAVNNDGLRPLHLLAQAAKTSNTDINKILTLLIGTKNKPAKNPVYLKAVDNDGMTALHHVIQSCTAEHSVLKAFISRLVKKDTSIVLIQDAQGNTALHYAAEKGFEQTINSLLAPLDNQTANALKALKNKNNKTAFDIAVSKGKRIDALSNGEASVSVPVASKGSETDDDEVIEIVDDEEDTKKKDNIPTALREPSSPTNREIAMFAALLEKRIREAAEGRSVEASVSVPVAPKEPETDDSEIIKIVVDEDDTKKDTQKTSSETYALHKAAARGDSRGIKELIEKSGTYSQGLQVPDQNGWLPLHYAAANGHLACVKEIIETLDSDLNNRVLDEYSNVQNKNGQTALHLAVLCNHFDIVTYLVNHAQAETTIRDNNNATPSDLAVFVQDERIHQFFEALAHKIKAAKKTPSRLSSKKRAFEPERQEYAGEKKPRNNTQATVAPTTKIYAANTQDALHKAAEAGDLKKVQDLLNRNINLNCQDQSGCLPLHYAAYNGHLAVVQELAKFFDLNLDPVNYCNVQNKEGRTVLHVAVMGGHADVADYLINQEYADTQIKDKNGKTPRDLAQANPVLSRIFVK